MRKILISSIKAYQYMLSPCFNPSCRYIPSCSQYALEAITKQGVLKGVALSVWRICRCHPFCKGGYDSAPSQRCKHG